MTAPHGGRDTDGFEAFYRTCRAPCLRSVLAITLDPVHAEDYIAEAFTRAFERWDTVSRHPAPAAWVVRTATNLHLDRRRNSGRLRSRLPAMLHRSPQVVDDIDADLTLDQALDPELFAALRALPARQRETLALRVLLGMTGVETAAYLGVTPGSVATHLHRALVALRHVTPASGPEPAAGPAAGPAPRAPAAADAPAGPAPSPHRLPLGVTP